MPYNGRAIKGKPMTTILAINEITNDNGYIKVEAVIDEVIETHGQTYFEPAEYGPAICRASYDLAEDQVFPDTEKEQISFLEDLDLDWDLAKI